MLKEALDYLRDTFLAAASPVSIDDGDRHAKTYVIGGQVKSFEVPTPDRAHHVGSLAEIVRLANRFAPEDQGAGAGPDGTGVPSLWYCPGRVVLLPDDATRDDRVDFELEYSDLFLRVTELKRGEWLEQKAFVRLLRIELAGALPPRELLEKVRKVKFESGATTTGEVRRDRESLGREINQRAESTEGEIPEEVTLEVPIYSNPGERAPYPIRCAVEVDPGRGYFRLVPLPDEIDRARQLALDSICDRLHAEAYTPLIYQGQP